PAKALLFEARCLRLSANIGRLTRAVSLAERVTTGNKGHRFFVVHGHTAEGFANILGGRERIRFAVRTLRIYIDQTHLYCTEWTLQITLAAVTLVCQPLALGAPIDVLFGLPDILT